MRREVLEIIEREKEKYKTIDTHDEKVYDCGFISVNEAEYDLNNGETINRQIIRKQGKDGSGTIIFPITKEGNVVIIVEPRVAVKGGVSVEVPAGLVEEGEDAEEVAKRELVEETGYIGEKFTKLVDYYPDEASSKSINYIYLAEGCEKKSEQHLDDYEYISTLEITIEEFAELIRLGYIRGGISITAYLAVKEYLNNDETIN